MLQVYEGLLEYRGNTTELAPALARSWTVSPDGSAIELRLRPNVKFHDGSALDAETVKQSIERTRAMNRGGAFFLQTLQEVRVVDRTTVRLVATQPSVSLLYGLPKVYITGKAHLADPDGPRAAVDDAARAVVVGAEGQEGADGPRPADQRGDLLLLEPVLHRHDAAVRREARDEGRERLPGVERLHRQDEDGHRAGNLVR